MAKLGLGGTRNWSIDANDKATWGQVCVDIIHKIGTSGGWDWYIEAYSDPYRSIYAESSLSHVMMRSMQGLSIL